MHKTEKSFTSLFFLEQEKGPERLMMLSDGVFAIAMTLLVLDIRIPSDASNFQQGLSIFFIKSIYYLMTFVVIAGYWRFHYHLMHLVKRVDSLFLNLSLLYLALVAFLPAAMNLLSDYSAYAQAVIVYVLLLAACGLLGPCLWLYAVWRGRLTDEILNHQTVLSRLTAPFLFPVVICLSLLLLLLPGIPPAAIFWSWCLLPLLSLLVRILSTSLSKWMDNSGTRDPL